MKVMFSRLFSRVLSRQRGSALIYTMIFMGLMVVAALVSVQFSTLEQKMSSSYRSSQTAFIAAEMTLLEAEGCIKKFAACNSITLFNNTCSNGFCFNGTAASSITSCRAGNSKPWQDVSLWEDTSKTLTATTLPTGTTGRYIIEFLCYVPQVLFGVTPDPSNPGDWSRLYRVTVLSSVNNINSQVMLQSTYKN